MWSPLLDPNKAKSNKVKGFNVAFDRLDLPSLSFCMANDNPEEAREGQVFTLQFRIQTTFPDTESFPTPTRNPLHPSLSDKGRTLIALERNVGLSNICFTALSSIQAAKSSRRLASCSGRRQPQGPNAIWGTVKLSLRAPRRRRVTKPGVHLVILSVRVSTQRPYCPTRRENI